MIIEIDENDQLYIENNKVVIADQIYNNMIIVYETLDHKIFYIGDDTNAFGRFENFAPPNEKEIAYTNITSLEYADIAG